MSRKILLIPLVLFLLLAVALLWQLVRNSDGDDPMRLESALIGKPIPEFRLESLDQPGKIYNQSELSDGKPLLLNVWATGARRAARNTSSSTRWQRRGFALWA